MTAALARPIAALLERHAPRILRAGARAFTYREAGQGAALVCLHGIGTGSASWVHQLEQLADRWRVVAWDAPGYGGGTALATAEPLAADYADALEAFLYRLGIGRCVLVAQSLGALMAASFAARQPDRVRGLLLLGPAAGYGAAPAQEREARRRARAEQIDLHGPERMAAERAAQLLSPSAGPEALELVRICMRNLRSDGYRQAAHLLSEGRIEEDAKHYRGPVLVLCGSADTITPERECRKVAAAFADAGYVSLPGLGHAAYVESPETVNGHIAAFATRIGA
jgi:pimeloyl-ACP methyl ester carboxylesterase